ncbi:hypothetical protein B9Z55_004355 [Caenorhabditis nigoni]|uniref:Uncharacterized protein n=1 Tax=Caenorhabditis nigoni TaxID=1611254 RepID=A0A2G5UVZ8_9PELO|nr:hypothetical protein B9Z55_004355 [Caenorhabditis nigoni]
MFFQRIQQHVHGDSREKGITIGTPKEIRLLHVDQVMSKLKSIAMRVYKLLVFIKSTRHSNKDNHSRYDDGLGNLSLQRWNTTHTRERYQRDQRIRRSQLYGFGYQEKWDRSSTHHNQRHITSFDVRCKPTKNNFYFWITER